MNSVGPDADGLLVGRGQKTIKLDPYRTSEGLGSLQQGNGAGP